MFDEAQGVFICYRREDSAGITGRLYDHLCLAFGPDAVFKDVFNIPLGVDYRKHIQYELDNMLVMLVVIGPRWLGAADGQGRRLSRSNDPVVVEIASALESDIVTIPVLVGGSSMPDPSSIPRFLRRLCYLNGVTVRDDPDFRDDMGRLIADLRSRGVGASRPSREERLGLVQRVALSQREEDGIDIWNEPPPSAPPKSTRRRQFTQRNETPPLSPPKQTRRRWLVPMVLALTLGALAGFISWLLWWTHL